MCAGLILIMIDDLRVNLFEMKSIAAWSLHLLR